jgi:hypothetical protein
MTRFATLSSMADPKNNDTVLQQPGVNIEGTLTPGILF